MLEKALLQVCRGRSKPYRPNQFYTVWDKARGASGGNCIHPYRDRREVRPVCLHTGNRIEGKPKKRATG